MSDNPELGFSVDTSDLEKATEALDGVSASAGRTEEAAARAGQAGSKMAHDFVPGVESMSGATDKTAQAAERYIQALQKQLDMLGKNKAEQSAIEAQYRGFSAQVQQQAADIGKKIDAWKLEEEAARSASKAEDMASRSAETSTQGMKGLSFATAGATREFIVLGHEALTGNFSRMPGSFMVLLERTGGLHSALAGLISPFGLLSIAGVGSLTAIAAAFYQGRQETKEFNNAITLTGNYAGQTASSFEEMAHAVSDANHVSAGSIREIADQLIRTGQISGEQLPLLTDATERYAKVASTDAAGAAKLFANAMEDPSRGAIELNKQMHFLTLAQYDQIAAMQKSGDIQSAQLALSKALDDHMKSASIPNLGYVARAWDSVTGAVMHAWDAMKGWGRDSPKVEQIAANNAEIAKLTTLDPNSRFAQGASGRLAELRATNARLQSEMAADTKTAQQKALQDRVAQEGIAARAQYNQFKEQFATPAEKRQQEIAEQMRNLDRIAAAGGQVTPSMRDDAIAKINAKYKDKKQPRAKIDHAQKQEDGEIARADAAYAKAQAQIAELSKADDARLAKLTEGEKRIIELQQLKNMPLQSRPGKVADSQIEAEIAAWNRVIPLQKQYMENELARKNADAAQKSSSHSISQWDLKDTAQIDKYRSEADGIGMSASQRKILAERMAIEADRRKAIDDLMQKSGAKSDDELQRLYPGQIAAINEAAEARQNKMIPALQQEIDLSQSWSSGWKDAFAKFKDSAENQASAASGVFNAMTNSMTSTLMSFFETGKLGWKSFASAVLQEIERIMVAKMVAGLIGSFAGAAFAGSASAAGSSSGGYSDYGAGFQADGGMVTMANGGGWMSGVQFYANGDVFDRPTVFQHSGGIGVLGEAGPEAVMPLTRGADGKLGVRAAGSGAGDIVINQYVTIESDGSTKTTGDGASSSMLAGMGDAVKNVVRQTISAELRDGGMINKAIPRR